MAKPKLSTWERKHLANISGYQRQIDRLYDDVLKEAARLGASLEIKGDSLFSFDDYPALRKRVERLFSGLNSRMYGVIVNGIEAEWTLANNKNSELARQVFGSSVGKLSQAQYRRYFSTNDNAREAFINRQEAGLKLSDRVWRYTGQFKREIELGLDVGIRNGMSAADMTAELRGWLREPDRLFRRVRDEHGELQLSKNAAAYHPGQGVYRSSYKNARRLAATETNIAYRTADYQRWQQLDFVVGIEIKLSNNHTLNDEPFEDICDELKGRYPKDFKFTGWHPHCRCHAVTILKTQEEIEADTKKLLNGEPIDGESVNRVDDVPKEFEDWVKDNTSRIVKANKLPYFMTDNEKYVADIMNRSQPSTVISKKMAGEHFYGYIDKFKYASDEFDNLYERLNRESLTDIQQAMIINQIKQECAALTVQDLKAYGMIGEDWVLARTEFDTVIAKGGARMTTNGKLVQIKETKLDMLVFKDKSGREFAYPIGAGRDLFNAVEASKSISTFPPYLREGIKRVSFLDIPCPLNGYWEQQYGIRGFKAAATDGGSTNFFIMPNSVNEFKGTMSHEAGHIIDKGHRFSESKGWAEAVAKDNAIYQNNPKFGSVSKYAYESGSVHEDFAESIRRYIVEHEDFKKFYPNRAAYIRSMAQKLSGYFPKTQ